MGGASQPRPSHLLIKLLVPCCSGLEKLLAVEDAVLIVQVVLHFPSKAAKRRWARTQPPQCPGSHCPAAEWCFLQPGMTASGWTVWSIFSNQEEAGRQGHCLLGPQLFMRIKTQ